MDRYIRIDGRTNQTAELDTQTEQHSVSQPARRTDRLTARRKCVQTEGEMYGQDVRTNRRKEDRMM